MSKTFSGNQSRPFWRAINRAEPKGPGVLYDYGCRAQEMESELFRLRKALRKAMALALKVNEAETALYGHCFDALEDAK